MWKVIEGILLETWELFADMSPYLILGFLVAGLLHVVIPEGKIYRHLSGNNLLSVIKASLFGVPLPLGSCGVIPVAGHLRKEGAGKSSILSFLISTPTTGIDSILATYSLLGPLFAIIRPIAAFFGGILGGVSTNFSEKGENIKPPEKFSCGICDIITPHSHSLIYKIKAVFMYAFFELVEDIGKWILIGVIAGGVIGYLVPSTFIEQYLGKTALAYPLMLLISIPMYVCATGSIPIAASLIAKGMTPGAGLIFLIAGPATNTATLSFVGGKLGKKILFNYLLTIVITALLFGFIIDYIWQASGQNINLLGGGMKMLPQWLMDLSGILLAGFILRAGLKKLKKTKKEVTGMGTIFKVPDMSCEHCVKTINSAIRGLSGVKDVRINLKTKEVEVMGNVLSDKIVEAIKGVGYSPEEVKQ